MLHQKSYKFKTKTKNQQQTNEKKTTAKTNKQPAADIGMQCAFGTMLKH